MHDGDNILGQCTFASVEKNPYQIGVASTFDHIFLVLKTHPYHHHGETWSQTSNKYANFFGMFIRGKQVFFTKHCKASD